MGTGYKNEKLLITIRKKESLSCKKSKPKFQFVVKNVLQAELIYHNDEVAKSERAGWGWGGPVSCRAAFDIHAFTLIINRDSLQKCKNKSPSQCFVPRKGDRCPSPLNCSSQLQLRWWLCFCQRHDCHAERVPVHVPPPLTLCYRFLPLFPLPSALVLGRDIYCFPTHNTSSGGGEVSVKMAASCLLALKSPVWITALMCD